MCYSLEACCPTETLLKNRADPSVIIRRCNRARFSEPTAHSLLGLPARLVRPSLQAAAARACACCQRFACTQSLLPSDAR